jgi:hypothetical protein
MRHVCSFLLIILFPFSCTELNFKSDIIRITGIEEYERLMTMSQNDFDQSREGFRKHADNYELVSMLIPEYMRVNEITGNASANLHWHLGQIHAFNDAYDDAISEMSQAKWEGSPVYWNCYVDGSIAFLRGDKTTLGANLRLLGEQEIQMNIEFLEKFLKYFDKPYGEAYSAEY